jgi:hypothetical protein
MQFLRMPSIDKKSLIVMTLLRDVNLHLDRYVWVSMYVELYKHVA